ncbi:MAG: hypothetical protein FJ125_00570 [Deltaproteobacteria bacterium]|nr:hypothetical protein [Deltaproteobacteria bacterium]
MSSAAPDPTRRHRAAGAASWPAGVAGAVAWGTVGLLLLVGWCLTPRWASGWWSVGGGLVVGALLGAGNVLLLCAQLQHGGTAQLRSSFGRGILWAARLAVLALLLYPSLTLLQLSPVALTAGATIGLAAPLLALSLQPSSAGHLPAADEGGVHGRG